MTNTNTTAAMPPQAVLDAIDAQQTALFAVIHAWYSEHLTHQTMRALRGLVEEAIGHYPAGRVDKVMDMLEDGMSARASFAAVLFPVGE